MLRFFWASKFFFFNFLDRHGNKLPIPALEQRFVTDGPWETYGVCK